MASATTAASASTRLMRATRPDRYLSCVWCEGVPVNQSASACAVHHYLRAKCQSHDKSGRASALTRAVHLVSWTQLAPVP